MGRVSLLLWDVGGVLLTNGFDRAAREAAAEKFGLDPAEFERRHQLVDDAFERGRLDWATYLNATVFDVPRSFTAGEFREFVEQRSAPLVENLAVAREVRAGRACTMATLNNESRELNDYRIDRFGLGSLFDVFFSSGYTGRRKPDPEAYRFALELAHRDPEETLLLDDRPENVAAAAGLGLRTILVRDAHQIRNELALAGVGAR
jgi:putative hydrolase of the HAD superfamily